MGTHYILDGHETKEVDLMTWARWFEKANRRVAEDTIMGSRISTVFLGLNYNWEENGKPLLFETLIFGGKLDGEMERYATWDEAETGHKATVKRVRREEYENHK